MSVTSVAIQFSIIDLLSKGVDRIKSRLKGLAQGNKEVQKSFDRMARSAKYAAVAGIATREMYKGLKPAVKAAGDLQAEMLGTRAELAGSVKDTKELQRQLKQIKSTAFSVQAWTPFDQAQIVALEKQLVKSGARVNAVIGERGAAAAAAALGTYEDLDPVAMGKSLIGIATPFKLQADQYMNLADQISRASSASTVGAAEIAETAKYAAPAMAQLGRDTEEMLTLSAMLAQRGIEASMAGTGLRQFFNAAARNESLRDAAGNLKPLAEITAILRQALFGLGEAEQLGALTQLFDDRGAPVAMALMDEGAASYDKIAAKMAEALPLQEKINTQMEGFRKQTESLRGTARSTIADLYQPALKPLTYIVAKMNEFVALIGKASQGSESLGKVVSGASLGGVGVGGLATLGLGGAALWYGRKVLKGAGGFKGLLGGAGSAAAGIATGKAVEAATGVQPVFVTNWPADFGSGVAGGLAGSKAGRGMLGKLGRAGKGGLKWLAALGSPALASVSSVLGAGSMGAIGSMGAGAMATSGALVVGAGAAGYGIGTLINRAFIQNTALGDKIGETLNRVMAFFGNEESRRAIEINMQIDEDRRITAESNDVATRVNPKLRRGRFAP